MISTFLSGITAPEVQRCEIRAQIRDDPADVVTSEAVFSIELRG
jgi:hypothetical protein